MEHNASDVQHNGSIPNGARADPRAETLWTFPLGVRSKVSCRCFLYFVDFLKIFERLRGEYEVKSKSRLKYQKCGSTVFVCN